MVNSFECPLCLDVLNGITIVKQPSICENCYNILGNPASFNEAMGKIFERKLLYDTIRERRVKNADKSRMEYSKVHKS